jgi:hypothetical protein
LTDFIPVGTTLVFIGDVPGGKRPRTRDARTFSMRALVYGRSRDVSSANRRKVDLDSSREAQTGGDPDDNGRMDGVLSSRRLSTQVVNDKGRCRQLSRKALIDSAESLGIRLRGIHPRFQRRDRRERRSQTVRQILEQFKADYGEIEIGLSVVTIVELTHGVQRAGAEECRDGVKPSWTN